MANQIKVRTLAVVAFALLFGQTSFGSPMSSCANNPGSPTLVGGVLTPSFTCNLYSNGSTTTIDLTPFMTQGGASIIDNSAGAGYSVIINGNPATLADNASGLYNTSLWDAVLYFPVDQPFNGSDKVIVYWPGSTFPTGSAVQTLDRSLYPTTPDAGFFTQVTGAETIFGAGTTEQFNIFLPAPAATPEPSSLTLLTSGIVGIAFLMSFKRFREPLLQNSQPFQNSQPSAN